jgi:hypothetical protein
LEDEEFVEYIKELMVRFPNTIFNGFIFNNNNFNLLLSLFPKINLITILSVETIFQNIEIFIATHNNYTNYSKLIEKIGYYSNLHHRVYFNSNWYCSNRSIKDLDDNMEDMYNFAMQQYDYVDADFKKANKNKAKLFFNKILENANEPLNLLNDNDTISDWYYLKRLDYVLKEKKVKEFLNRIFK